jgi:hypothetical protein
MTIKFTEKTRILVKKKRIKKKREALRKLKLRVVKQEAKKLSVLKNLSQKLR